MTCGIYKITNIINDKNYIGQAVDIKKRWYMHIWKLEKDSHDNPHLQRSWRKYGKECFEFSVLEECEVELLIEREQFWMDYYKAFELGYNQAPVAGSTRGYRHTAETRAKMSAAKKGNTNRKGGVCTAEHRAKLSAARKGKPLTAEHRAKMSAARKGKPLTAEHRAKMSAARCKPIILTAPDGTETEWPSAKEAARALGLNNGALSMVLSGKMKSHKRLTARFKE